MTEQGRIKAERQSLRDQYGELFDEVSAILLELDPVGINFVANADEYEPEVGTISPRLETCRSASDVQSVVHQEFVRWFDADTAGPIENYEQAGQRVWEAWRRRETH
jgi:hypothetical protein